MVAATLDGEVPTEWLNERLRWMPAHRSRAAIGRALRSDGAAVTSRNWRANRLVDAVAKAAAYGDRLPSELRQLLATAYEATEHAAATLGLVTQAANNYQVSDWRLDGTCFTKSLRDAWLPPYLDRGGGKRKGATGQRRRSEQQPAASSGAGLAQLAPDTPAEEEQLEDAARERLLHARAARARTKDLAAQKEAAAEARGWQTWYTDRAAKPTAETQGDKPGGAERLAALRRRVLAKRAMTQ